ncbi:hypothetical protein BU15DRAFT_43066 [Melanogaster broomeanus]|nr:hypothetical protein BU15DRAFT_43066 [Melanogaster broomeanus]
MSLQAGQSHPDNHLKTTPTVSTGPEPNADLVAVACVVEASLILASEWSRILTEYVFPLLKRLNELHPTHQFRLALVTYGAADTRPSPLLSKGFFAHLSQVTKDLREDPSKFGIGQTNSGGGRGLSALEGLVAAIELFDILMASSNLTVNHAQTQSQTSQKDSRSIVSHLFHIATSPPDNAQRPQCNTLQHLDSVTWESIPTELKKRKINLSLISLRKIPQFQDLQSLVAGHGAQSPWFNVHVPHVLSLSGFPTPQKTNTKRPNESPLIDRSTEPKRHKVAVDPVSKSSSGSPALPAARIPLNQRPQQPLLSQSQPEKPVTPTQPAVSLQYPSSSQPGQTAQLTTSASGTVSASPSPSIQASAPRPSVPIPPALNPEILDQVVVPTGLKFGQLMERLKALDKEIATMEMQVFNAQSTGQMMLLAEFQEDQTKKTRLKEQIRVLLKQHYQKVLQAAEAQNAQAGIAADSSRAGPIPPIESAGPSTQAHPSNSPSVSSERLATSAAVEHKSQIPDSQILAQFWQSRGGTVSTPNFSAGPSQAQSHPHVTPEVAAQMQKLIDKKGIRPLIFGPSQASTSTPQDTDTNLNVVNNPLMQAVDSTTWHGTFMCSFPQPNGQATKEIQLQVVGMLAQPMSGDVRTDTWPKNLNLIICKEPLKDAAELSTWLKRQQVQARVLQFRPSPRASEGPINEQMFFSLNKLMTVRRLYAYAGWQLPSGKFSYNILIFPMGPSFAGAVFPDGLPDLPGTGNIPNIPQAVMARLQGLDPAQQKQVLVHFARVQHEQLLRQRQQQQQQQQHAQTVTGLDLGALGMPIPANPSSGSGGTVNYEMLQSFMQRNADGSASQESHPG